MSTKTTTSAKTEGFYSLPEVIEKGLLGKKTLRSLQRMCKLGQIECTKFGNRYFIPKNIFSQ